MPDKPKKVSKFDPEAFEPFTPSHWLAERNQALEQIEKLLIQSPNATQDDKDYMSDPLDMFTRLANI